MARTPNPLAMELLGGELVYLFDKAEWNTGRLGPVSQKLATQGFRLRQRTEGDGLFVWAEETGVFKSWSELKNKHVSR